MKNLNRSHSDTISLETLSSISVRINCCNDEHGNVTGTGTIIKDEGTFYVLTAAHCLEAEDDYRYLDNEITIEREWKDTLMTCTILRRVVQDFDTDKDFAILEISEPKDCSFDFDHDLLMIRKFSSKRLVTTYGFTKGFEYKGRSYDLEPTGSQKYSVKENVTEKGEDLCAIIGGLSGSGLFIRMDGRYLCVGYVKGIETKGNVLGDITVYPMSHFDYNWTANWYECVEEVEEKLYVPVHTFEPTNLTVQLTNESKINYTNLWDDLYSAIYNKRDITSIIQGLKDGKILYPVSKNTRFQELVIDFLFRKKGNWSVDEQQSFLLALRDRGLWPSLYGKLPEQAAGIEEKALFHILERRGDTICDPKISRIDEFVDFDDAHKYEEILRAAFSFSFDHLYALVSLWKASDQWIIKKALLKNLFGKDEESYQQLHDYIQIENLHAETKFLAMQVYNSIDIKFPREYTYGEFHKAGLDSFTAIINSIADNIDKKQKKLKLYGTHYVPLVADEDVTSFSESLHLLSVLIETGFTTNMNILNIIASERWFKVCRQLINFCPLPVLFYTLQYKDSTLIRKVGQYLAYNYDDQNPKLPSCILKILLCALRSKHFPSNMNLSILQLTRELYVAANEKEWYILFYENVLQYQCNDNNFYKCTISDAIFQNMQAAIRCLKIKEHKQEVFRLLLKCFERNKILVNILINDVLYIQSGFFDSDELNELKKNFLDNTPLCDGYCIFYKLLKSGNLEKEDLVMIDRKSIEESIDFTKVDLSALGMLLELINNEEAVKKVKQILLSQDMWHCGIREEGATFSLPNSLHLEKLSAKVIWEENEWEKITQNMRENLSLLNMEKTEKLIDNYFSNEYLKLINEMKSFLVNYKNAHRIAESKLEMALDTTLVKKRGYIKLYEALLSEDYIRLPEVCGHLCTLVETQGIKDFEDDIDLLINRVTLKHKVAITSCLKAVDYMLSFYKEEMAEKYGRKLIQLLHNMINYDFEELDVNVPVVNRFLHNIAKNLKTYYETECCIDYWLNDIIANRFN